MQLSLSAEPALGLVLGFSEVTGLFPQARPAQRQADPLQAVGLRGKTRRAGSWLRPPPATSLRTPSSWEAGPASPGQMSPDPDLPGPEKPPSQGGWPHPHLVLGSYFGGQGAHSSPASLHHSHHGARSCLPRRAKGGREPGYGAQGMAWMEGSRTGGSRLSSQLVSMFFRSVKTRCRLSPISARRCEEGCVRLRGVGRSVFPPNPHL